MIPFTFIDKTREESAHFPECISAYDPLCETARTLKVLKCPNLDCDRTLTFNKGCQRNKAHFCHVGHYEYKNVCSDERLTCNESAEHAIVKLFLQGMTNRMSSIG